MEIAQLRVPGYDQTIEAPNGIPNPNTTDAGNILGFVLALLLALAVIGAIVLLLWGAIGWITSQGDKQKIEKARGTIVAAIIGLVIVILSFVIVAFLGQMLGVPGLRGIVGDKDVPYHNPCNTPGEPC